jgi:CelD/BcsL family acetyltransferase involved in cellulose biosynthesis
MVVHRLGFDPEFARYSPGLVNTLDTIETAAAEGLTRVEFLGGAERYKLELADRFDPLCQGIGLARGPLARGAVEARLAYIRLRLRLKRHQGLRRLYVDGMAPVRRLASLSRAAPRT